MSEALTKAGVENQLITIPNGKHVFDEDWQNRTVQNAFDDVIRFLRKHLQKDNKNKRGCPLIISGTPSY